MNIKSEKIEYIKDYYFKDYIPLEKDFWLPFDEDEGPDRLIGLPTQKDGKPIDMRIYRFEGEVVGVVIPEMDPEDLPKEIRESKFYHPEDRELRLVEKAASDYDAYPDSWVLEAEGVEVYKPNSILGIMADPGGLEILWY